MTELENSEVIKSLISAMIKISGRKTNKGHAISTMDSLIRQLETRFNFLKNVQIIDTRYSEDDDPVSVMSDINIVESSDMGKAIYDIIKIMNRNLGSGAGHFFIKELHNTLSEDHTLLIKDMGVDLGLLQLESEVEEWGKLISRKK